MLRIVRADEGADLTAPVIVRLLARAIDDTLGAEIDELVSNVAALERRLAETERRCETCLVQHCPPPTPILSRRERITPTLNIILDDAERRLAEGIDLEVIAECYGVSPVLLGRQLVERATRQARGIGMASSITLTR